MSEISPIVGIGQENFNFEISEFDLNNKSRTVKFEPNIAGVLRVGINALGFGIGYSFRTGERSNDPKKGYTNFSDWQLGYNNKNWSAEFIYQNYTGLYTTNTNDIQFHQNLNFNQIAINGRYAIEENSYSVGGMIDQSEAITDTIGRYYLVGGLRQHVMHTDSSLLQQELTGINNELENLRELHSQSVNLGAGVGKAWLFSNQLYTGALFDLITTYANYNFLSTTGESSLSDVTLSYNIKLAFGYVGTKYKSGVSLAGDITTLKTPGQGYLKPSANRILIYLRTYL